MNNCFGGDNNCLWILLLLCCMGDNNNCLCDILPLLLILNACGNGHTFGNIGRNGGCGCGCNG